MKEFEQDSCDKRSWAEGKKKRKKWKRQQELEIRTAWGQIGKRRWRFRGAARRTNHWAVVKACAAGARCRGGHSGWQRLWGTLGGREQWAVRGREPELSNGSSTCKGRRLQRQHSMREMSLGICIWERACLLRNEMAVRELLSLFLFSLSSSCLPFSLLDLLITNKQPLLPSLTP